MDKLTIHSNGIFLNFLENTSINNNNNDNRRFRIWLQLVLEFLCCLLDIEYRNNRIN
ncbi:hypothetical protein Smp_156930 [Schistosoma mansoni]|uniref:hypothetical protein n=1 Tax=Schistosoma mansoni TaxID=6183 RepID=UPI00022DBE98|nr:hypothetical protein Smp_156930 [Schistosoma mansoni]|eukprot:XP_018652722.1 hypothetical protein Smp_156930 [Schistosoma mansoni]